MFGSALANSPTTDLSVMVPIGKTKCRMLMSRIVFLFPQVIVYVYKGSMYSNLTGITQATGLAKTYVKDYYLAQLISRSKL